MRRAAVVLVVGLILTLAASAPGQAGGRSIWLPYWDMTDALRTVTANADLFGSASPFWYDVTSCSSIDAHSGAGDTWVVRALRAKGLAVMPTYTATGLTPARAVGCLGRPVSRAAHVQMLARSVVSHGYDGIDIDYETLAVTTRAAQAARVRSAYSAFVRDLCARMSSLHKRCVITVMARTDDSETTTQGRLSTWVFDYRAICPVATRIRVMAYDQHTRYTRPGPVAGWGWDQRVIGYVRSTCDPSKVELGVPLYGRDWGTRSFATIVGDRGFALARAHHVTPRYDPVQHEYTFGYRAAGQAHRVWMAGPRSVADRTRLVRIAGLAGAVYWAAGQQPSGTWSAVRRGG